MDEKVVSQEVIQESPFPGEDTQPVTYSQSASGDSVSPTVVKDKAIPIKKVALELLSTALNTRSRKILQEFQLQQSGGLQIGDFKEGIAGDIRLTPNGITARDIAGLTTFAIDGTTGDAFFKGLIQSGAIISGNVIVGDNSVVLDGENRRILVYNTAGSLLVSIDSNGVSMYGSTVLGFGPDVVQGQFGNIGAATGNFQIQAANGILMKFTCRTDATFQMGAFSAGLLTVNGDLHVTGAVSKGSGAFDISHPDKSKPKGTRLRHSFVESPTEGDTIYRFKVKTKNKKATIKLPEYFKFLNKNPQAWISPVDVLGIGMAKVNLKEAKIEVTKDGTYNVLIIGTRKDYIAKKYWKKYGLEYIKTLP